MLQKFFGYKVELIEHSPDYTLVKSEQAVVVGTQIPVRVSGANGKRTSAVPMVVVSCRPCEEGGYLVTGRFLVEHPDLSGLEIPQGLGADPALRSDHRVNCHLCVISRDLPGYRVMTMDISEGGIQVVAPSRVALGNSVLLRIEFDTEQLPSIQASATVAWCRKIERGRYRIGLQFKSLDERGAEVIGLYRRLVDSRASADIANRTLQETTGFAEIEDPVESSLPTLQVLQWEDVPIMKSSILLGYRREGQVLQVRLRGIETGLRCCDYKFTKLRAMRDNLEGEPQTKKVLEFRYADVGEGYFRFQFLGEDKVALIEVEAKSCTERSTEHN